MFCGAKVFWTRMFWSKYCWSRMFLITDAFGANCFGANASGDLAGGLCRWGNQSAHVQQVLLPPREDLGHQGSRVNHTARVLINIARALLSI